jgi:arsenate reductase-like glutaredoxin family protein
VNANKIKIHREEALELARAASSIWVTKGKKLIRFDPAADASDDEIAALILGRSGTLRAPAFRSGDTFMVGYSEEAYTDLFA